MRCGEVRQQYVVVDHVRVADVHASGLQRALSKVASLVVGVSVSVVLHAGVDELGLGHLLLDFDALHLVLNVSSHLVLKVLTLSLVGSCTHLLEIIGDW